MSKIYIDIDNAREVNMKKFSTKETCEYIEEQLKELYSLQWNH